MEREDTAARSEAVATSPATREKARAWFALTALAVLVGIIVQVAVAAGAKPPVRFDAATERALNVFVFFTIQSNLIVGGTSLLLVLEPKRSSTVFSTFRLIGVVAIAITGIVFHAVIAQTLDLESWPLVADRLLHLVVPVMGVLGWLMFGPRGLTNRRVMWLSLLFPVLWLAFTLIRGAIIDWYPYHFIDVVHLGYVRTVINCLWVALLTLAVAAGATALDRRLPRRVGS
jgi:hypothetical protein